MEDVSQTEQKPQGNWVPISKAFLTELPLDRPYTKLEAMFSLAVDYDMGKQVTQSGYAALWGWHRGKVNRFLKECGVEIRYQENTGSKQNQSGQITSRKRADNEQIKFIDSKWLRDGTDRKQTENEQITSTTINPNPKPNPKPKKHSVKTAVFILPDWVPVDAWNGYVEMRVKKKKPLTDRAANLIIADLEKLKDNGQDPGAVLDCSTKRNWLDMYPLPQSAIQEQSTKRGLAI